MSHIMQSVEFLGQESDPLFQDGQLKWKLDQQVGIKVRAKSCSGARFRSNFQFNFQKLEQKFWAKLARSWLSWNTLLYTTLGL